MPNDILFRTKSGISLIGVTKGSSCSDFRRIDIVIYNGYIAEGRDVTEGTTGFQLQENASRYKALIGAEKKEDDGVAS